ncbi:MAG TPA: glycosyltransferase, partial [Anaerolineales bacterium]|nr:glycosyltransferase [Anaerolineales bacterium]
VYEGMAMGLPVVAAAVGGQPELVTPESGYLVPLGEGERERYVAAVSELLRDPVRRKAMGAIGRQRIEAAFNIQTTTDHFVTAVQRAIALNAGTPRPRLAFTEAQQLAERVAD